MNSETLKKITEFLESETSRQAYADVHVMLRIHDGRISLIEQTVSRKLKLTEVLGGANVRKHSRCT